MEIDWSVKLIFLVILLAGSSFFSGSEVALFSLNKRKINQQFKDHLLLIRYLKFLIENPRRLLVTILIGNTIVNVAASIVAVTLAIELSIIFSVSTEIMILIQIILLTILILIFGELLPKVYAIKNPIRFARVVVIPMYWLNVLIFPIAETLTEFIKATSSRIRISKIKTALTKEEISDLTELGTEKGTLEHEEQEIIKSIVSFRDIFVSEVMTPRVDILAIEANKKFDEVVTLINETGHSRFPVYEEHLDHIIGILYAKDILHVLMDTKRQQNKSLTSIIRRAIFVPRNKKIYNLLRDFQAEKTHIAIVVDEYGGTAGLITLEDIIEEVVGEIWDEYDVEEDTIIQIDENHFLVLGKTPIDELNERLGSDIISEEAGVETVGGLVFKTAGSVPKEGYEFTNDNFKFTVKEVHHKRIKKVLVERENNS